MTEMKDPKKYVYKQYSPLYKKQFQEEKSRLKKILPSAIMEHVGSTSIPGLGGKGIIDIAIKIPKNKIRTYVKKLSILGYYTPKDHSNTHNSIFLKRKIHHSGKYRWIHVHLVLNQTFWNSFIIVKNYLINHKEARDKYSEIKREAVRHAKGEGKEYREYKNDFLEEILRKGKKLK